MFAYERNGYILTVAEHRFVKNSGSGLDSATTHFWVVITNGRTGVPNERPAVAGLLG
jgi:hypothetical protein